MSPKTLATACVAALFVFARQPSLGDEQPDDSIAPVKAEASSQAESGKAPAAASAKQQDKKAAIDRSPIKSGQPLTVRQKRIFIVGLEADAKQ